MLNRVDQPVRVERATSRKIDRKSMMMEMKSRRNASSSVAHVTVNLPFRIHWTCALHRDRNYLVICRGKRPALKIFFSFSSHSHSHGRRRGTRSTCLFSSVDRSNFDLDDLKLNEMKFFCEFSSTNQAVRIRYHKSNGKLSLANRRFVQPIDQWNSLGLFRRKCDRRNFFRWENIRFAFDGVFSPDDRRCRFDASWIEEINSSFHFT